MASVHSANDDGIHKAKQKVEPNKQWRHLEAVHPSVLSNGGIHGIREDSHAQVLTALVDFVDATGMTGVVEGYHGFTGHVTHGTTETESETHIDGYLELDEANFIVTGGTGRSRYDIQSCSYMFFYHC